MAEELMRTTKDLLIREEERARGDLLSRQDLENVRYPFSSATLLPSDLTSLFGYRKLTSSLPRLASSRLALKSNLAMTASPFEA
jgi:hypothetical protein